MCVSNEKLKKMAKAMQSCPPAPNGYTFVGIITDGEFCACVYQSNSDPDDFIYRPCL